VEVGGSSYREAAEELGIRLENLKMVIFRARRKIFRAMRREFDGMSPDCRPAREPKAREDSQQAESPRSADRGGIEGNLSRGTRSGSRAEGPVDRGEDESGVSEVES
jgi:hypothetical protein